MTLTETLTKQLYCSRSEEATVFSLQENASLAHISYLQYNLKLWSGAYQTQSTTKPSPNSHPAIDTIHSVFRTTLLFVMK